jgi:hypothetical protein
LIGNFKNAGRQWCKSAEPVLAHDWPADSIGRAIPYGVYEVTENFGYVCVGDCFDTPRFAVDAIADWWCEHGCRHYRDARRLLILADAGGSNGYRSRVWKAQLLNQLNAERDIQIKVRQVKYLNNIVEQDHRAVKRITRPMLGFKSFRAAQAVLAGIELMHMIRKGQFMIEGCDGISFADQFYALAGQVRPA